MDPENENDAVAGIWKCGPVQEEQLWLQRGVTLAGLGSTEGATISHPREWRIVTTRRAEIEDDDAGHDIGTPTFKKNLPTNRETVWSDAFLSNLLAVLDLFGIRHHKLSLLVVLLPM